MKEQYKQVFKVAVQLWSKTFGVRVGVVHKVKLFP